MKSVVICASNKFSVEARDFGYELEELGVVVFFPHFYSSSGGDWNRLTEYDASFVARGLTLDHFRKIQQADVVFIYNKDGYSGVSVALEIAYAAALNKPIYAFSEKDSELCRSCLFSGIVWSSEKLLEKLK